MNAPLSRGAFFNILNTVIFILFLQRQHRATLTPSSVWFASGSEIKDNLFYEYDGKGNITAIKENGKLAVAYEYDNLNRLVKEDNKLLNKVTEVVYDNNGNILYKHTTQNGVTSTDTYLYDGDKLVSFNGEICKYNKLGSPTTYRDKELKWLYGKLLEEIDGNKYIYDGRGQRVFKNSTPQIYDFNGHIIGTFEADESGLQFIYDDKGVAGVIYNKKQYFYRKDIQGNIIAILDQSGNIVVKYVYDAWGNHAVLDADGNDIDDPKHIGNVNPFRYRGYFYDVETGLYYLQTRYYDPETGRFISQDSTEYAEHNTVNGLNLYAYCGNNPVMNVDPTGHFFLTFLAILGTLALGTLIGGVSEGITETINGGDFWAGFAGGAVSGFISTVGLGVGLLLGGVAGLAISVGSGLLGSFSGSVIQQGIEKGWNKLDLGSAFISGIIGGFASAGAFALSNFMMRNSVGLFEQLFDKTIKFSTRLIEMFKISPESFMLAVMFQTPFTIIQNLIEIIRNLAP